MVLVFVLIPIKRNAPHLPFVIQSGQHQAFGDNEPLVFRDRINCSSSRYHSDLIEMGHS